MTETGLSEKETRVIERRWGRASIARVAGIFPGMVVSGPLLFAIVAAR